MFDVGVEVIFETQNFKSTISKFFLNGFYETRKVHGTWPSEEDSFRASLRSAVPVWKGIGSVTSRASSERAR